MPPQLDNNQIDDLSNLMDTVMETMKENDVKKFLDNLKEDPRLHGQFLKMNSKLVNVVDEDDLEETVVKSNWLRFTNDLAKQSYDKSLFVNKQLTEDEDDSDIISLNKKLLAHQFRDKGMWLMCPACKL